MMGVKYYVHDGPETYSVEISEYYVLKSHIGDGNRSKSSFEIDMMLLKYAIEELKKTGNTLWGSRSLYNFLQENVDCDDFNDLYVIIFSTIKSAYDSSS